MAHTITAHSFPKADTLIGYFAIDHLTCFYVYFKLILNERTSEREEYFWLLVVLDFELQKCLFWSIVVVILLVLIGYE